MKTINVLLADDHALFRRSMRHTVNTLFPEYQIQEAENGHDVLEICRRSNINLVLLDINMPLLDGIKTAKQLMQLPIQSRPYIIILSMYHETALIHHLLEIGVHGYLGKNCQIEELEAAINKVMSGQLFYPHDYDEKIKRHIHEGKVPYVELTQQEKQLIQMLSEGKTNKEIAHILDYSVRTIESKRLRLEKKLQVKNTPELITQAFKVGFLDI